MELKHVSEVREGGAVQGDGGLSGTCEAGEGGVFLRDRVAACRDKGSPTVTGDIPTPQANIELMRTAFAALGRKDADAIVKLMPSDFIINIAGVPYQKRGTDTWRKHADILFSAFPDIHIKIEDIFAVEDKVTVRLRISGTHAGEFLGIQPTGKRVEYESTEIYRITGGKIAEEWICSDMLTLMAQIGGQGFSMGKLASMWLSGYRVWFALFVGGVIGALSMVLLRLILT